MYKIFSVALFLGAAALILTTGQAQTLAERNGIINSTHLDNLQQFPHQVGIQVHDNTRKNVYCSGNILSNNWILTATSCVGWKENVTISLMFNRLNLSNHSEKTSYTVNVPYSRVTIHHSANLALINLPVGLKFDLSVAPIALALDPLEYYVGHKVVMAGIEQNTTRESYGIFEVILQRDCGEKNRICTLGWSNSSTVPCESAQGGGLLINWPWAPRLIGVFSDPLSCLSFIPAYYFRVSHYVEWISGVIGQHVNNDGYFSF